VTRGVPGLLTERVGSSMAHGDEGVGLGVGVATPTAIGPSSAGAGAGGAGAGGAGGAGVVRTYRTITMPAAPRVSPMGVPAGFPPQFVAPAPPPEFAVARVITGTG